MTRQATPVIPVRLLVLLWLGGAALPGAQAPGAPVPGAARGSLTVKGQAVTLTHAYAALEPNTFDETKDDIVVVLTDRPIPPDTLAAHSLGGLNGAAPAAGIENYLRFEFAEADEHEKTSSRAILGAWIIGHRTIGHAALEGRNLQVSPDPVAKMASPAIARDRIAGRVYSDGPQTFPHDHEYAFDVTFDVVVAARRDPAPPATEPVPPPAIDAARATTLPDGGGEPGRAYLAYNQAIRDADFAALERLDFTLSKVADREKTLIRDMLPKLAPLAPTGVRVLAGRSDGSTAVLELRSTGDGTTKEGGAELALVGGRWMVLRDWWR